MTWARAEAWAHAHRAELLLFAVVFSVYAGMSGPRFLRQSAAPHFVYQADAWLQGRTGLDPRALPNLEDWACVREAASGPQRCEAPVQSTDRWYVSFPPFPAVLMVPFVWLQGLAFNDTSFTVMLAAVAVAAFVWLMREWTRLGELQRDGRDRVLFGSVLAFGTVFFSCALRGEVWFTAGILGVLLSVGYFAAALRTRHPLAAGTLWAMATLTRAPLLFALVFFLVEALSPEPQQRFAQLWASVRRRDTWTTKLFPFVLGALPWAVGAAIHNRIRFGRFSEFGHRFLFDNRVNADIDQWGLFHPVYLQRNLEAAFLRLPEFDGARWTYSPHGLSLWLTLPVLLFLWLPSKADQPSTRLRSLCSAWVAVVLVLAFVWMGTQGPSGPGRLDANAAGALVVGLLCVAPWLAMAVPRTKARVALPLLLTASACGLPGLLYQNSGYAQFGFRFSLDVTVPLLLWVASTRWSFEAVWTKFVLASGFITNFWGAAVFCGYTEWVRKW